MGVISYLLEDALGVPYGLFGVIIWVSIFLVAFFFGLVYFAQFLLPIDGAEGWQEGLQLLTRIYSQGQPTRRPPPPLPTGALSGLMRSPGLSMSRVTVCTATMSTTTAAWLPRLSTNVAASIIGCGTLPIALRLDEAAGVALGTEVP